MRHLLAIRSLPLATFVLLAGCGGASVHTVDAPAAEAGVCGTHAEPGILKVVDLTPPMGATVDNRDIVHSFTVIDAPAEFRNFELRFGPRHTAGQPRPENPRFTVVTVENRVFYQLTISSWSLSPAHVEAVASAGFDTSAGCSWRFPSPLFSYDIVGGPDGGSVPEPPARVDGAPGDLALDTPLVPLDAPLDGDVVVPPLDAPALDAGALDAPPRLDGTAGEAGGGLDLAAVDAAIDS